VGGSPERVYNSWGYAIFRHLSVKPIGVYGNLASIVHSKTFIASVDGNFASFVGIRDKHCLLSCDLVLIRSLCVVKKITGSTFSDYMLCDDQGVSLYFEKSLEP